MAYPEAGAALLAMLQGDSNDQKILAIKAVAIREVPGANAILIQTIQGADQPASREAMKALYFTATIDDLRELCKAAAATEDADLKKSLTSICSKIATRIDTDEARALVADLK